MKAWLKRFFRGMWVACLLLLLVALGTAVIWLLSEGVIWLTEVTPPTPTNMLIFACVAFVVAFGVMSACCRADWS